MRLILIMGMCLSVLLCSSAMWGAEGDSYAMPTGSIALAGGGQYSTADVALSQTDGVGFSAGGVSTGDVSIYMASGYAVLNGSQPSGNIAIKSAFTGNSTLYSTVASLLDYGAEDSEGSDIVSVNVSNADTQGTWQDLNSPSTNISSSNVAWTLEGGSDGDNKTVTVWFSNASGMESAGITDAITLDVTGPNPPSYLYDVAQGTVADISRSTTTNYYGAWATATDNLAGVYRYEYQLVSNNIAVAWTASTATSDVSPAYILRGNTMYYLAVRAQDNVGNYGAAMTSNGVIVATPSIQLTKTAINKGVSGTEAKSGLAGKGNEILEYTVSYNNTGQYAASNVDIYDIVPTSAEYVAGSATGGDAIYYITDVANLTGQGSEPSPANLTKGLRWRINTVAVGGTGSVKFRVVLAGPAPGFSCGTTLVQDNVGNTYNTVAIGNQCWMKENMRTTKYPDGTTITTNWSYYTDTGWGGKYSGDTTANVKMYGLLYQWSAVVATRNGGTSPHTTRGICPSGWHVPKHDEFTTLERAVCTSGTCATDFPYDTTTEGLRGTNEATELKPGGSSGFSGVMAGWREANGLFYDRGGYVAFWTSSEKGAKAWYRYLSTQSPKVNRATYETYYGFSVRCAQD